MQELRAEPAANLPLGILFPQNDDVKNLHNLRACIDKNLRLRPTNVYGLLRIVSARVRQLHLTTLIWS